MRAIDLPHAARAELVDDSVVGKPLTNGWPRRCFGERGRDLLDRQCFREARRPALFLQ